MHGFRWQCGGALLLPPAEPPLPGVFGTHLLQHHLTVAQTLLLRPQRCIAAAAARLTQPLADRMVLDIRLLALWEPSWEVCYLHSLEQSHGKSLQ